MRAKIKTVPLEFSTAIRSFLGYLEGTGKSEHTIKNYELDVKAFQAFFRQDVAGNQNKKTLRPDQIGRDDLKRYSEQLRARGLKTNTRRRKILTIHRFLAYLAKRNKVRMELAERIPAPHKIERIPYTVSSDALLEAIQTLKAESLIEARNRCLLWTLAETGCLVSEVTRLQFSQWGMHPDGRCFLQLQGKAPRSVPVSFDLMQAIHDLKRKASATSSAGSSWIFFGFNKFGSLGSPITPRGVELLVKHSAAKLGFQELTPRTFRHSIILKWFQDGLSQNEIQNRLGLKTTYAFRTYEPLFNSKVKSSSKTTSTFETNPLES